MTPTGQGASGLNCRGDLTPVVKVGEVLTRKRGEGGYASRDCLLVGRSTGRGQLLREKGRGGSEGKDLKGRCKTFPFREKEDCG